MFTKDEFDMLSLCSSSIYCRYVSIRYEINPSFAKQTYRVRQHISNAIGVYRKSREGFISMRDTPLRVSRYIALFIFCAWSVSPAVRVRPKRKEKHRRSSARFALSFSAPPRQIFVRFPARQAEEGTPSFARFAYFG